MSSNIYKNYRINMGIPFQVKIPEELQNPKSQESEDKASENTSVDLVANAKLEADKIINKAREDAAMIVKESELEALRIIQDAQNEAEEFQRQVYEETKKAAYEEGYKDGKSEYESLIYEAEIIREHAKAEYNEVLAGIEGDAVDIIIDIAKRVIHDEINLNKENVILLMKQAIEKCSNKDGIVARLSSDDYDYVIQKKHEILSSIEGVGEIEIKKDPSLKNGSCIIETPFGSIDGSYQKKLEKIEKAFKEAIGS